MLFVVLLEIWCSVSAFLLIGHYINTYFRGPLNDCSISLDTWCQAPMESLRSLITDPSCLELCNCSLPTIPDIIELQLGRVQVVRCG